MRREFLTAGLTGGIIAFLPLLKFDLTSDNFSEVRRKSPNDVSTDSINKLREVGHKYGGEFGEVEV